MSRCGSGCGGSTSISSSRSAGRSASPWSGHPAPARPPCCRVIAGLLAPGRWSRLARREVWLDTGAGVDLAPEERRCGYLFQEYALFPQDERLAQRRLRDPRRRAGRAAQRGRWSCSSASAVGELADAPPGRALRRRASAGGAGPGAGAAPRGPAARRAALRAGPQQPLGLAARARLAPRRSRDPDPDRHPLLRRGGAARRADRRPRPRQGGPGGNAAASLARSRASAFVADFTGAIVLRGSASADPDGLTAIALDGGGTVRSTDGADGRVALSVFPWEISLEPPGAAHSDSALNRVGGEVRSLTEVGNRVRVGIALPQALTAEVTARSVAALDLRPGSPVTAAWKATATRVVGAG